MDNFDKKWVVADLTDSPNSKISMVVLTTKTQMSWQQKHKFTLQKNGFNKKNIQGMLNMFYILSVKKLIF